MGFRDWLWRHSEQGRAWQAFERGDARYETELDVATASFNRTVEAIEEAGWCFANRVDHVPVKRTTVNPQSDGGHEVIKTVEQRATFYFTRAETARIAPAMEQAAQERRAEEVRRQQAIDASERFRKQLQESLVGRPHRARALGASVLLILGSILTWIFFAYTEKTTESGHLWWKETTTTAVTLRDKLPLLITALVLISAGLLLGASAIRKAKLQNQNVASVASVRSDRKRRATARALAARDPGMARDLGIGRPDLGRSYDDGGLVEVNSAPTDVMVEWLGLSREQAERVVKTRRELGGFESEAELTGFAGLDARTVERIRDRIILI